MKKKIYTKVVILQKTQAFFYYNLDVLLGDSAYRSVGRRGDCSLMFTLCFHSNNQKEEIQNHPCFIREKEQVLENNTWRGRLGAGGGAKGLLTAGSGSDTAGYPGFGDVSLRLFLCYISKRRDVVVFSLIPVRNNTTFFREISSNPSPHKVFLYALCDELGTKTFGVPEFWDLDPIFQNLRTAAESRVMSRCFHNTWGPM